LPTRDEALAVVAEILEVPSGSFSDADDLETLGWDSLADLTFMSIADERYGVTVEAKDLANHETPADLVALLGA
jgi:acyl carrier protein